MPATPTLSSTPTSNSISSSALSSHSIHIYPQDTTEQAQNSKTLLAKSQGSIAQNPHAPPIFNSSELSHGLIIILIIAIGLGLSRLSKID